VLVRIEGRANEKKKVGLEREKKGRSGEGGEGVGFINAERESGKKLEISRAS
jgi:hypothetical protein